MLIYSSKVMSGLKYGTYFHFHVLYQPLTIEKVVYNLVSNLTNIIHNKAHFSIDLANAGDIFALGAHSLAPV